MYKGALRQKETKAYSEADRLSAKHEKRKVAKEKLKMFQSYCL